MKKKIAALAIITVIAGVFAFTRTKNVAPPDFRDAVGADAGDEGSGQFNTSLPAIGETDHKLQVPQAEKVRELPAGDSRFMVLHPAAGASVTLDNTTAVMWVTNPNDAGIGIKYNWTDADAVCKKLVYAGYSDWRLPEADTLKGIRPRPNENSPQDPYYTEYFLNTRDYYWSSTNVDTQPGAWRVNFTDFGQVAASKADQADGNYIRCVRTAEAKANGYNQAPGSDKQNPGAKPGKETAGAGANGASGQSGEVVGAASGKAYAAPPPLNGADSQGASAAEPDNSGALGAIAGAGAGIASVGAAINFVKAVALKEQALAGAAAAGQIAASAKTAAATGQMAQAQKLGMGAKTIGETAKQTGAQAAQTAHFAVVLTAISGALMVADGVDNIIDGLKEESTLKEALDFANKALDYAVDPAEQAAAMVVRDALQVRYDKAKKLVVIGSVKTASGALQLGSLLVAPTAAPFLLAAGAVGYMAAMVVQHWDGIKNFFRRIFGKSKSSAPAPAAQMSGNTGSPPEITRAKHQEQPAAINKVAALESRGAKEGDDNIAFHGVTTASATALSTP